jgi:hypothetical protein
VATRSSQTTNLYTQVLVTCHCAHLGCGGQEALCIPQQHSTSGPTLQLWNIQAASRKGCEVLLLYVRALLQQPGTLLMKMLTNVVAFRSVIPGGETGSNSFAACMDQRYYT